jgi:hypothetical protein
MKKSVPDIEKDQSPFEYQTPTDCGSLFIFFQS